MKKIILFLIGCMFSFSSPGQDLNTYKYVIVPKKFEFTKEANMYQVNSLTEFLFHKYGFDVFLEGEELPEEIERDKCRALYAEVEDDSGLFVTRLKVILKDCRNKEIFVSDEGTSRSKDYKTAYHEALRKAFESLEKMNYSYKPGSVVAAKGKPDEEINNTVIEKKTVVVTAIPKFPVDSVSENKTSEKVANSEDMEFIKDEIIYHLKKSGKGFDFYQKGMTEPFASLIPTQTDNSFIYSSVREQGIATIIENGDLVIEIFKRETNSKETKIFKLRN